MNSILSILDYALFPRLGVGDHERAHPQKVLVSIRIHFSKLPDATCTDRIEDTLCYEKMTSLMTSIAASREFKTIESMAMELSRVVIESLDSSPQDWSSVWLKVHKVNVPIRHLEGGTAFELTQNRRQS